MLWLLALMMATSLADLATTEIGLQRGYTEMNPLLQNQAVRVSAKLIVPVGIFLATAGQSRKRRIVWGVVASAVWGLMAGRNLYIMYTHPL